MPRPTQRRLQRAPDFSPEVGRAPQLGVYAPLNVQVEQTGAERLAEALGMINTIAQPALANAAAEQGRAAANVGMLDAQLGRVDPKRQAEDEQYARGVKRITVERATLDALNDFQRYYEESFDKTRGPEELQEEFNKFMQGRLSMFLGDAEASAWALERLAPAEQKLVAEHNAMLAEQFKLDTISTVGDAIRQSLASGQPVDVEEMKRLLTAGGFTLGEAAAQYVDIIGSLAVERRDPRLLEVLIPEKWADGQRGPRSVPALLNKINQYRYYAEVAAEAQRSDERAAVKAQAEAELLRITQIAARGDVAEALRQLDAAIARGVPIERTDYSAIVNFARGSRDDLRDQLYNPVAVAEFRMDMLANPDRYTPADAVRFVATMFPPGRAGFAEAQRFLDDFQSAYNSAQLWKTNSKAKAYRSALVTRHKPAPHDPPSVHERYAAGLLAFDVAYAETRDPERALEAANKTFEATEAPTKKPTGDVRADATAFANGELTGDALRSAYRTEEDIDRLIAAIRRGEVPREVGDRMLAELER